MDRPTGAADDAGHSDAAVDVTILLPPRATRRERAPHAGSLRPMLLLDVDGVLNLYPVGARVRRGEPLPDHLAQVTYPDILVVYEPAMADRLARLWDVYDIVWATSWGERANQDIGPLFGLPRLPVAEIVERLSYDPKANSLWRYLRRQRRRPTAWLDDTIYFDDERIMARRRTPTLLVRTDPAYGLTDAHVTHLLDWAREVGDPGAVT